MIFRIKSYLQFLWRSQNEHGLHSPFVFSLVTKCFYDSSERSGYKVLDLHRDILLKSKDVIEVADFGAGSKVFKSNSRKVSKIARTAGTTNKRARLLLRITDYFKVGTVLEIGTSVGLGTAALALGNPDAKVISVEGCKETSRIAADALQKTGIKNTELHVSEFQSFIKDSVNKKFDLVFFDGNHQKEATLKYFEMLLQTAGNDSVWIFDDIHWSEGMQQAWQTIKSNQKVTVTIDTYQWGFVFFRREQAKEHFTIRV